MRRVAAGWLWSVLLLLTLLPLTVAAAVQVQVEEAWPAGREVVLRPNQHYFLRLSYHADTPTRIWAEPYVRGARAHAGSNPSPLRSGSGEALGWFFLFEPGAEVDEIRIRAGDGGSRSTPMVAVVRVQVRADAAAADPGPRPEWVTRLLAADQRTQEAAAHAYVETPPSASDQLLMQAFMLGVVAARGGARAL